MEKSQKKKSAGGRNRDIYWDLAFAASSRSFRSMVARLRDATKPWRSDIPVFTNMIGRERRQIIFRMLMPNTEEIRSEFD